MKDDVKKKILLVAEDDDDHFLLTVEALQVAGLKQKIHRVKDGKELLDYLFRRCGFKKFLEEPLPALILLDLNMPKKDGRYALAEIKKETRLSRIPIVVLTTSLSEDDAAQGYDLGIDSYIRKPVHFNELVEVMEQIRKNWLDGER